MKNYEYGHSPCKMFIRWLEANTRKKRIIY